MSELPLPLSGDQLVEIFGRELAAMFDKALTKTKGRIYNEDGNPRDRLNRHFSQLNEEQRYDFIAQKALESLIHNLMLFFDESDAFEIVGVLKTGEKVNLKNYCPEGLHGQQLDWLEEYQPRELIDQMLFRLYPTKA